MPAEGFPAEQNCFLSHFLQSSFDADGASGFPGFPRKNGAVNILTPFRLSESGRIIRQNTEIRKGPLRIDAELQQGCQSRRSSSGDGQDFQKLLFSQTRELRMLPDFRRQVGGKERPIQQGKTSARNRPLLTLFTTAEAEVAEIAEIAARNPIKSGCLLLSLRSGLPFALPGPVRADPAGALQ